MSAHAWNAASSSSSSAAASSLQITPPSTLPPPVTIQLPYSNPSWTASSTYRHIASSLHESLWKSGLSVSSDWLQTVLPDLLNDPAVDGGKAYQQEVLQRQNQNAAAPLTIPPALLESLTRVSLTRCAYSDLKDVGSRRFPENFASLHRQIIGGTHMLQILKAVDIAHSQQELLEKPEHEKRMWKLVLFDGVDAYPAIERIECRELSHRATQVGVKLMLHNVMVRRGTLMLEPHNCIIFGGNIPVKKDDETNINGNNGTPNQPSLSAASSSGNAPVPMMIDESEEVPSLQSRIDQRMQTAQNQANALRGSSSVPINPNPSTSLPLPLFSPTPSASASSPAAAATASPISGGVNPSFNPATTATVTRPPPSFSSTAAPRSIPAPTPQFIPTSQLPPAPVANSIWSKSTTTPAPVPAPTATNSVTASNPALVFPPIAAARTISAGTSTSNLGAAPGAVIPAPKPVAPAVSLPLPNPTQISQDVMVDYDEPDVDDMEDAYDEYEAEQLRQEERARRLEAIALLQHPAEQAPVDRRIYSANDLFGPSANQEVDLPPPSQSMPSLEAPPPISTYVSPLIRDLANASPTNHPMQVQLQPPPSSTISVLTPPNPTVRTDSMHTPIAVKSEPVSGSSTTVESAAVASPVTTQSAGKRKSPQRPTAPAAAAKKKRDHSPSVTVKSESGSRSTTAAASSTIDNFFRPGVSIASVTSNVRSTHGVPSSADDVIVISPTQSPKRTANNAPAAVTAASPKVTQSPKMQLSLNSHASHKSNSSASNSFARSLSTSLSDHEEDDFLQSQPNLEMEEKSAAPSAADSVPNLPSIGPTGTASATPMLLPLQTSASPIVAAPTAPSSSSPGSPSFFETARIFRHDPAINVDLVAPESVYSLSHAITEPVVVRIKDVEIGICKLEWDESFYTYLTMGNSSLLIAAILSHVDMEDITGMPFSHVKSQKFAFDEAMERLQAIIDHKNWMVTFRIQPKSAKERPVGVAQKLITWKKGLEATVLNMQRRPVTKKEPNPG